MERKMTGENWWQERRLVAFIPKSSFDKFQFFTLDTSSTCSGCYESMLVKDELLHYENHVYYDFFLRANIQIKYTWIGDNYITVRAPREYIDIKDRYFYSLIVNVDGKNELKEFDVNWEPRPERANRAYYYATIRTTGRQIPKFLREKRTLTCFNKYGGKKKVLFAVCGGTYSRGGGSNWKDKYDLSFEIGGYSSNDSIDAFLAGGITARHKKWRLSLLGGVNSKGGVYTNLRGRCHLLPFKIKSLILDGGWQKMGRYPTKRRPYGTLYLGSEFVSSSRKSDISFAEFGINMGCSFVKPFSETYTNRLYFQFGVARDLLNRINTKAYSTARIGLIFNLF